MFSIKLDDKTARELNWLAKERNADPNSLAVEAIQAHLRAEARRAMEEEVDAFRRLRPQLLESIPGEYAAIYQGQLVDHDSDLLALLRRVEERYAGRPVLIRLVQAGAEPVIRVRLSNRQHWVLTDPTVKKALNTQYPVPNTYPRNGNLH